MSTTETKRPEAERAIHPDSCPLRNGVYGELTCKDALKLAESHRIGAVNKGLDDQFWEMCTVPGRYDSKETGCLIYQRLKPQLDRIGRLAG
jgi:hypothetical protein